MDNQNTDNSNTTQGGQTCANCGMEKAEWRGNNGQGVEMAGKTYCCTGCASGAGCACA